MNPAVATVPLHEALLDDATVDQLFFDVAQTGALLGVSLKGGARALAEAAAGTPTDELARARALLRSGVVAGVQLRYRHQDREWWDTLLRVAGGVRLIRICHDDALATGG